MSSPIEPFLARRGVLLLDGGLATELERQGFVLDTALWSAQLLSAHPEAIRAVHRAYLDAGADCITTASYQASFAGFLSGGFTEKQAASLLTRSVTLAGQARDDYVNANEPLLRPLVAAGIGPYGAFLADGAEYRGDYGLSEAELRAFHERRWEVLASSDADLLACETIPSLEEAQVLLELLEQTPGRFAWFGFSCRDGTSISDGTPIVECAKLLAGSDQVIAVGVNCTPPRYVPSLIDAVREGAPDKPIVVYPNSGEAYDGIAKTWTATPETDRSAAAAKGWFRRGARLIGGCCRVGPEQIAAMREALPAAP